MSLALLGDQTNRPVAFDPSIQQSLLDNHRTDVAKQLNERKNKSLSRTIQTGY
jgi:FixJ family two-component response regulator